MLFDWFDVRTRGMLSGIEIAEAVERQREYRRLCERRIAATPYSDTTLSWAETVRQWWLKRQPRIHVDDFDPTPTHTGGKLGPNSYDLTIAPTLRVYAFGCLSDQGSGPPPVLDTRHKQKTTELQIPAEGFVLRPGVLYLGATVEHTESYNCVPYIDGRSSTGRLGMCVHLTAGAGDRGYCGAWTTEITVVHPLRVHAGDRICQIKYVTVGRRGWEYAGRYQNAPATPVASRMYLNLGDEREARH